MAYLVEVPVEGGGRLLVEAADADPPADLELASPRPGVLVARARESLEAALEQVRPVMGVVAQRLRAMAPAGLAPDEVTVEFGLVLGAEAGAFVGKASGEAHFTVTLTWKGVAGGQRLGGDGQGDGQHNGRDDDQKNGRDHDRGDGQGNG